MTPTTTPKPPHATPKQDPPGSTAKMNPVPDHGESTYKGSGKLTGKVAVITGGDSGIGRAVAIAFAREGADVVISYLNEDGDAGDTAKLIEQAGRKSLTIAGDLADPEHCRAVIDRAVKTFGRIDVLVNNAAFQKSHESLDEITDEEWDYTFDVNIGAMFRLTKAAIPHMKPGSAIVNSASVNVDKPRPTLVPYAATKAAIQNFTASLAQLLASKGIRANCVAPGPIWTPLIPATMSEEEIKTFGGNVPLGRPGQPAELAHAYVLLASDDGSYISGSTLAVTGGKPVI
jgi:NAD(P)-dependent dehydrogenase (short-subunit alcohol dehydrogenase family)